FQIRKRNLDSSMRVWGLKTPLTIPLQMKERYSINASGSDEEDQGDVPGNIYPGFPEPTRWTFIGYGRARSWHMWKE
ncbi:MAG: hypothetical protein U5K79_16095, partial [Cyclobacteriaceae bacterium]|nr:hypothetical protein [Cyclobacteriaceae bacterium]